jgi:hypothetical protein
MHLGGSLLVFVVWLGAAICSVIQCFMHAVFAVLRSNKAWIALPISSASRLLVM